MAKKLTGIYRTTALKTWVTSDGRGIKLSWHCPNCGARKNYPVDSVFNQTAYGKTCDYCQENIVINNPDYARYSV